MKQCITCLCILGLSFLSQHALAQRPGKKFSVGFGFEGGLPTGDAKTYYQATGGMTIRFSVLAGPGYASFTTGGIGFIPKDLTASNVRAVLQVPAKFGYKYVITGPLFVMGELGYSHVVSYYKDQNDNLASSTSGGFTYAPAIGVQSHSFEFSIRYESVSLNGGSLSFVGGRLGFNF